MKISHELKMKIIAESKIDIKQHHNEIDVFGRTTIIPLYKEISLFLDLNNKVNLFEECKRWMEMAMDASSAKMKIDISCFEGLFPIEIDTYNNIVTFTADVYDPNNQDWKDWFIMEEEE